MYSSHHGDAIPDPLRVASVPTDHVYVRHLAGLAEPGQVVRLPDPPVPGAPAGQWWPAQVLDPAWLRAHADRYDLVHVHFGFEHLSPDALRGVVDTLRALHRPLVLTVHDLDNPHLSDQQPHHDALDVLVPAADALITLTPGAARRIARRWGRPARVLAHPHVVPLARMHLPRPAHVGFVVGLHDKPRAGNAAALVRVELQDVVAGLPGGRLHPGHAERLDDAALWDHLAGLDALVLPYLTATHSGFVEACADLGTPVVATRAGHLAEQQQVVGFTLGEPGSLAAAVREVHDRRPVVRARPEQRARQREELAAAHADLYAEVVARGAAGEAA